MRHKKREKNTGYRVFVVFEKSKSKLIGTLNQRERKGHLWKYIKPQGDLFLGNMSDEGGRKMKGLIQKCRVNQE